MSFRKNDPILDALHVMDEKQIIHFDVEAIGALGSPRRCAFAISGVVMVLPPRRRVSVYILNYGLEGGAIILNLFQFLFRDTLAR